jgi:uncharacterized protein YbaP (TraB family)
VTTGCRMLALLCLVVTQSASALALWELEGARGQVRLLGSIHFLRPSDYPLPPAIERAYEQADVLVMELDMDDLDPLQAQASIMQLAMDPQGRDLEALMGSRDFAKVRNGLAAINVPVELVQAFEPWFAALQITQMQLMQLGFDPNIGLEQKWAQRARGDHKEVRGLETLEDQLGALDSMPARAQNQFLLLTIEEAEGAQEMIDRTLLAWRDGDLVTLERETTAVMVSQPMVYERLLVDRNRAWARQIGALARDGGNYLVVVGSAHLLGDDSVLVMLDQAGYPAKRISR